MTTNDRVQAHLDGDLTFDELSAEERREVRGYRRALDGTLAALRREAVPDLSGEVMERVRRLDGPREAGATPARSGSWGVGWLWRPRRVSFRLRPAWALAAVVAVVILFLRPGAGPDASGPASIGPGGTVVASSVVNGRILVRFRLEAPGARSVSLAGDFTGWRPTETLTQTAPGQWTVVVAVEPGIYEYAFVVDGSRWVEDPLAEPVDDGFGGANSRLAVLHPAGMGGA